MKKMALRALPALLLAAFSGVASAGGFQLLGQNASDLGTAYAGTAAVADNASTVFFNPAGMTQLKGFQLSVGVMGLGPYAEFHDKGSSGNGLLTGLTGGDGGNPGSWMALPNAYMSWQLTPELFLGFGISAPFGLSTKYDQDWIGRYQAIKSEIKTVNYNPSLAYRVNDKLSLGIGLDYQVIDLETTSASVAGGYRVKGDDTAWGWNAGLLFSPSPAMRIGVSYRSGIDYSIDSTRSLGASSVAATTEIKMPDSITLSVWQQVSDRWEAMGDLAYTRWGRLETVNVQYAGGTDSEAMNYKNAWRVAWGAAYRATDTMKVKFGIAYDRSAVSETNRAASLPDNDRLWLALGGQWNAGRYGRIDLGYSYLYVKDTNIRQTREFRLPNGTLVGSSTLSGNYDSGAHLVGLQYSVGF